MLKFEKLAQKKWRMTLGEESVDIEFIASSVTNKFQIVTDFVDNLSNRFGNEFYDWFFNFIKTYSETKDEEYLLSNITVLKEFINQYFSGNEFDYNTFVNKSKIKKGTILFTGNDIEKIIKVSCYLKLYSFISNSKDMQLSNSAHQKVYNIMAEDILDTDVVFKIFNVVKTKVFRYNLTDKYMWEYIKMIQCKTIDVHTVEIFNFIMNSILILCEEDKNPISYFVGVVEESVKWFLRSVYKKTVVYDDAISTEDIHGMNIDNLKTYSYNDTLGKLKGIAYDYIYNQIDTSTPLLVDDDMENNKADQVIAEFQERVLNIKHISPLCECIVFPILSKMTNIPYTHFITLSPEHSIVLSVYLQKILFKVFKSEYEEVFKLLCYFPKTAPAIATTYKIKKMNNAGGYIDVHQQTKDFFGFNTIPLPYKIVSYFVGRTSRINWQNIFDGKSYGGLPLSKIESHMVKFYSLFFSGQLDDKIAELKVLMDNDF